MKNRVAFLLMHAGLATVFAALPTHRTFSIRQYTSIHRTGLKRTPESQRSIERAKHKSHLKETTAIPGKSDISALVSLPENQGDCGACWDFSLTKALRSAFMVAHQDPGALAFNYLLNNCGPGPSEEGCGGGDFPAAGNFLHGDGPWLNSQDPYTGQEGQCMNLPEKATAVSYSMLGSNNNGPTFKDLAYEVGAATQMVSIDVAASDGDWSNYSGGIYNDCQGGAGDINHMIDLVGYDCETSVDANGNCSFDKNGVEYRA